MGTETSLVNIDLQNNCFAKNALRIPSLGKGPCQQASPMPKIGFVLITVTTAKFHQFSAEICGFPPLDVKIVLNTIKLLTKAEKRSDSRARLIKTAKTPAWVADRTFVRNFQRVTNIPGTYTQSSCDSYLECTLNRRLKYPKPPTKDLMDKTHIIPIVIPPNVSRLDERNLFELMLRCNVHLVHYAYKMWLVDNYETISIKKN